MEAGGSSSSPPNLAGHIGRAFPNEVYHPSKRGRFNVVHCSYAGACVRRCLCPVKPLDPLSRHVCPVEAVLVKQGV